MTIVAERERTPTNITNDRSVDRKVPKDDDISLHRIATPRPKYTLVRQWCTVRVRSLGRRRSPRVSNLEERVVPRLFIH